MKNITNLLLFLILIVLSVVGYSQYRSAQVAEKKTALVENNTMLKENTVPEDSKVDIEKLVGMQKIPETSGISISGKLCYPSEGVPSLDVYLYNIDTDAYELITTAENTATYEFTNVQPGSYHLFAYLAGDTEFGGGYTQAVPCGLSVSCQDHSLINVAVSEQSISNIDICDWYGADIPYTL